MVYKIIKLIASIGLKTFFRKISFQNTENIPKKGPVIFVCNHPNLIIDAWLVGMTCNRRLYFLAKSTIFRGRTVSWILSKLGLIPVYRKQDGDGDTEKNADTFIKAYSILEKNGAFLIFPEGISVAERKLNKIKTGAARIGFGAMVNNNWNLNVTIVPVGLSYENIIKFKSEVIIKYGTPIKLNKYKEDYIKDEIQTVRGVTTEIEEAITNLTTNVRTLEHEEIVNALELIYKKELMHDLGLSTKNKTDEFSITKGLISGVEWYFHHKPSKVEKFKSMFKSYKDKLDLLGLKDEYIQPNIKSITLIDRVYIYLYIIIGFPFYMYGLINNYIPYKVPRWLAKKLTRARSEIASTKLLTGMVVFIFYYLLEISMFNYFVGEGALTVVYALTLIPSGNFVLSYYFHVQKYKQYMRFFSFFYQKRYVMQQVTNERNALIDYIDLAKDAYLRAEKAPDSIS